MLNPWTVARLHLSSPGFFAVAKLLGVEGIPYFPHICLLLLQKLWSCVLPLQHSSFRLNRVYAPELNVRISFRLYEPEVTDGLRLIPDQRLLLFTSLLVEFLHLLLELLFELIQRRFQLVIVSPVPARFLGGRWDREFSSMLATVNDTLVAVAMAKGVGSPRIEK